MSFYVLNQVLCNNIDAELCNYIMEIICVYCDLPGVFENIYFLNSIHRLILTCLRKDSRLLSHLFDNNIIFSILFCEKFNDNYAYCTDLFALYEEIVKFSDYDDIINDILSYAKSLLLKHHSDDELLIDIVSGLFACVSCRDLVVDFVSTHIDDFRNLNTSLLSATSFSNYVSLMINTNNYETLFDLPLSVLYNCLKSKNDSLIMSIIQLIFLIFDRDNSLVDTFFQHFSILEIISLFEVNTNVQKELFRFINFVIVNCDGKYIEVFLSREFVEKCIEFNNIFYGESDILQGLSRIYMESYDNVEVQSLLSDICS